MATFFYCFAPTAHGLYRTPGQAGIPVRTTPTGRPMQVGAGHPPQVSAGCRRQNSASCIRLIFS
jgi:hypothetical protein